MNDNIMYEDSIEIKNEPLPTSSQNSKEKRDFVDEAWVLTVPIQNCQIKQETEVFCKPTDNTDDRVNIKKELHDEVDLHTLKYEDLIESTYDEPFKAVSKINRNNKYLCFVCRKHYSSSELRREHFIKHFMKQAPVICHCGRFFIEPFLFLSHHFVHYVKKGKRTTRIHTDDRLASIAHSRIRRGEKSYKFKIFSKQLLHKSKLREHSRTHNGKKQHKCEICLKQFSQKPHLTQHSRIHTGEKSYTCKICCKQFSRKYHLNRHSRTHTGDKRFKCEICSKNFFTNSCLTRHSTVHTGDKPYTCKICLKQFSDKSNLTTHSRIHSGEKPFECKICSRCFTEKSRLRSHLRVHTGEKPYKCAMCLKRFSLKSSLTIHIRIHTGVKPYKCKICLKQFNRSSTLAKHSRTHTALARNQMPKDQP